MSKNVNNDVTRIPHCLCLPAVETDNVRRQRLAICSRCHCLGQIMIRPLMFQAQPNKRLEQIPYKYIQKKARAHFKVTELK